MWFSSEKHFQSAHQQAWNLFSLWSQWFTFVFVHRDESRKIFNRKTTTRRGHSKTRVFFLMILLKGQSILFLTKHLNLFYKHYIISLLSFSQNCITVSSCHVTLPDLGRIFVDFYVRSFCNELLFSLLSPPSSHLRKLCCSVWTTCLRQLKPLPDFHGLSHYSAVSLSWSGSSMNWIRQLPGSRFHRQLGAGGCFLDFWNLYLFSVTSHQSMPYI